MKLDQCFQLRLFEQDCEKVKKLLRVGGNASNLLNYSSFYIFQMFDWICRNREIFLMNYIEIGDTFKAAKILQDEHSHFTINSMVNIFALFSTVFFDSSPLQLILCLQNVYVNINRILTVAQRMIDTGHYALQHIRVVADKLDKAWKEFIAGLDERTAVLSLSVLFHHKAEQVSSLI